MITLPDGPIPAVTDLTANNILITGDYGIGKSGLLASTGYLLMDPEGKLKAYPNLLRVDVRNWQDHKDFVQAVSKKPAGTYPGIGLDSLNVSYDHCLAWTMANVKFAGLKLTHPSENPQLCYPRITHEFITWLRELTMLGYHIIATCHTNIAEIKNKAGMSYNRWVPAFTGGSSTSTYANVLKIFSVVGFMTLEEVVRPATRTVMGKPVADVRAEAVRAETKEVRVIHFDQSLHWLANNKLGGFPDKVVLTDRWEDDWRLLTEAWGHQTHEEVEEEIETTGQLREEKSAQDY